ncbi:MAG: 3-phosphoserine/phosphohydroxythreonine transaminase, partial [Paludibacteraceae bacterium]|nr:3-phosphoserine/phosphohydroxythreonine transaminase [Paludibacteraceae bacterium]
WLKKNGGVQWIDARNQKKADLLYDCIDNSKIFMPTITEKEDRSRMNICFVPKSEYEGLFDEFFAFASERGMVGIKGHRLVGGFRASCYNAMDVEGVQALVDCIHDFEKMH